MPREIGFHQLMEHPSACAMGNVYRFVEPVILRMLKDKGESHGYQLSTDLGEYALTDAEIERAALYRTLRRLEANGYVRSSWNVQGNGPARRVYALTDSGERHLEEWCQVLDQLSKALARFVRRSRRPNRHHATPRPADAVLISAEGQKAAPAKG